VNDRRARSSRVSSAASRKPRDRPRTTRPRGPGFALGRASKRRRQADGQVEKDAQGRALEARLEEPDHELDDDRVGDDASERGRGAAGEEHRSDSDERC
jgi:hypothetical protein